jgi:type IV pilus assembly protein PilX
MSRPIPSRRAQQTGLVLIASLLLLLVVTILALAMFRNTGLSEKIAGNVREKERALHAAVVAEQYAEWWLSGNATSSLAPVICNSSADINVVPTAVLICSNAINPTPVSLQPNPQTVPWTDGGGNSLGFTFHPNSGSTAMSFVPDSSGSTSNTYAGPPSFYIQYMGVGADGGGSVYKIDAVGYGGTTLSVAVVESMYEIGASVKCLSCQ